MTNTLKATPLIGGASLIEGTDEAGNVGQYVAYSLPWMEYCEKVESKVFGKMFDTAVNEMFAPLLSTIENIEEMSKRPGDEWRHVTVQDGAEGKEEITIELDRDGIILYLLQEAPHKLRWVTTKGTTMLVGLA